MFDLVYNEVIKFITSEQIFISILGVAAIVFSQSKNEKLHKWASVFGLIGQPFWFYMAYKNQTWGVFALCILYTFAWFSGFKKYWINKD